MFVGCGLVAVARGEGPGGVNIISGAMQTNNHSPDKRIAYLLEHRRIEEDGMFKAEENTCEGFYEAQRH